MHRCCHRSTLDSIFQGLLSVGSTMPAILATHGRAEADVGLQSAWLAMPILSCASFSVEKKKTGSSGRDSLLQSTGLPPCIRTPERSTVTDFLDESLSFTRQPVRGDADTTFDRSDRMTRPDKELSQSSLRGKFFLLLFFSFLFRGSLEACPILSRMRHQVNPGQKLCGP